MRKQTSNGAHQKQVNARCSVNNAASPPAKSLQESLIFAWSMDIILLVKDIRTKLHHIASAVCGNTQGDANGSPQTSESLSSSWIFSNFEGSTSCNIMTKSCIHLLGAALLVDYLEREPYNSPRPRPRVFAILRDPHVVEPCLRRNGSWTEGGVGQPEPVDLSKRPL